MISEPMRLITTKFGLDAQEVEYVGAQHLGYDFLVRASNSLGELTTTRIEAKTDRRGLETGNLAIELWRDNLHPERQDGWFYTHDADVFAFVQTDDKGLPRRIIAVKTAALKECVENEIANPLKQMRNVYDDVLKRCGKILCLPLAKVTALDERNRVIFHDNGTLEVWQ